LLAWLDHPVNPMEFVVVVIEVLIDRRRHRRGNVASR
jgi:hypothetical protein